MQGWVALIWLPAADGRSRKAVPASLRRRRQGLSGDGGGGGEDEDEDEGLFAPFKKQLQEQVRLPAACCLLCGKLLGG